MHLRQYRSIFPQLRYRFFINQPVQSNNPYQMKGGDLKIISPVLLNHAVKVKTAFSNATMLPERRTK